jgi:hypothetical protein
MREYTKFSPLLWESARFQNVASDEGRFLFLYLLTNKHQNSAGCYKLPAGYACVDLSWETRKYQTELDGLQLSGMIRIDEVTSEILIERWFRHNAPMNEKHRTGTARVIATIQSRVLREAASNALDAAWAEVLQQREEQSAKKLAPDRRPYSLLRSASLKSA